MKLVHPQKNPHGKIPTQFLEMNQALLFYQGSILN